jgi:DNA-damage-inducible protein J
MAASAVFEYRMDEGQKAEAERICAEEGLTLSEVFKILVERTVAEKHVPIETFRPNATTIAAMEAARRGEVTHVGTLDELMAELHADD